MFPVDLSNLLLAGMVPEGLRSAGQFLVDGTRATADVLSSSFQALMRSDPSGAGQSAQDGTPAGGTTATEGQGGAADLREWPSDPFAELYRHLQSLLESTLEGLWSGEDLRVRIQQGGMLALSPRSGPLPADSADGQRLKALEEWLNSDHRLVDMADRLQRLKADRIWRMEMGRQPPSLSEWREGVGASMGQAGQLGQGTGQSDNDGRPISMPVGGVGLGDPQVEFTIPSQG
jgi:hypothetical protein